VFDYAKPLHPLLWDLLPALDPNREESQLIDVHGVTTSTERQCGRWYGPGPRHWIKNNRTSAATFSISVPLGRRHGGGKG